MAKYRGLSPFGGNLIRCNKFTGNREPRCTVISACGHTDHITFSDISSGWKLTLEICISVWENIHSGQRKTAHIAQKRFENTISREQCHRNLSAAIIVAYILQIADSYSKGLTNGKVSGKSEPMPTCRLSDVICIGDHAELYPSPGFIL